MKILVSVLALVFVSCSNKPSSNVSTSNDASSKRSLASPTNARLQEGDKFKIRFKQRIDIPFDSTEVTLQKDLSPKNQEDTGDLYLFMKNLDRMDRHIESGTVINMVMAKDLNFTRALNNLIPENKNSEIERIVVLPNSFKGKRTFSHLSLSFDNLMCFMNSIPSVEVIGYEPAGLSGSKTVQ